MPDNLSDCSALCKAFRCDKHPSAFKTAMKNGRKKVQCTWVEDECEGSFCKFGLCTEHRMTSDGRCRRGIMRSERDSDEIPRDVFELKKEQIIPEKFAKKFRSRGSL
jgi:hypothetical protein